MRYFVWVDFKYEMVAIFLGAVALILVYLAWASYPKERRERTAEQLQERRGHELETGQDIEKNPVAPFLIFIYTIIPIWSVLYLVYMWASGARF
jgi:hypothetical protein